MDAIAQKRDWVYAGLAHPANVILVRPRRAPRLKPGDKILLLGDEQAAAVGAFMGKLALESQVNLRFEWERQAQLETLATPRSAEKALKSQPTVVVALLRSKSDDPKQIASRVGEFKQALGNVPLFWVLPLGPETADSRALALALHAAGVPAFSSALLDVHRSQTGAPSARGFAGWAGAIWGWLR